jgi:hypothetical protein
MAAEVGDGRTEAAYEMRSGEDEYCILYEGRRAFGVRHVIETATFRLPYLFPNSHIGFPPTLQQLTTRVRKGCE